MIFRTKTVVIVEKAHHIHSPFSFYLLLSLLLSMLNIPFGHPFSYLPKNDENGIDAKSGVYLT